MFLGVCAIAGTVAGAFTLRRARLADRELVDVPASDAGTAWHPAYVAALKHASRVVKASNSPLAAVATLHGQQARRMPHA